jgi:hypothetical protein
MFAIKAAKARSSSPLVCPPHQLNNNRGLSSPQVFSALFPERLHLKIIVDPPFIFWGLLKAAKPFIAQVTANPLQAALAREDFFDV